MSPRKLSSASGRKPASRNQVIEVGLRRFESFERFGSLFRSSGQVAEGRRLVAERLVEPQVLRQRVDPLLAADHVADPHRVVVDGACEVVGRVAVGLEDDLVVDQLPLAADLAAQEVLHDAFALGRHGQADRVGLPRRRPSLGLGCRQFTAPAVVAREALLGTVLAAHLVEPLAGAEATIGAARGEQPLDLLTVQVQPLALAVRALVPVQPEPAQSLDDRRLRLAARPRTVRVLDPQHERAAAAAREGEVDQRLVRGADVGVASRRRRHADPHRRHGLRSGRIHPRALSRYRASRRRCGCSSASPAPARSSVSTTCSIRRAASS